jgi:uncharacterized iron-regulated membrane protein
MRKFFKKIHLWLAVPFGIFLTLICFSGAMLIFEPEVNKVALADLYDVDSSVGEPLPMEQLMESVAKTLPDSVSITGVTVSANPNRAYQVSLSQPRRASVWVDQYTGEVKGMNRRLPFFQTMFYLHRWLLNKEQPADGGIWWGKMIVGWSVLAFVVVLISGVIIWWPRTKSAIANRFKVCFGKGSLRLWHDSHVSLGIYAAIFLLASAVTGLTWSFQWYNKAFYSLFGVDTAAMQQHGGKGGDKGGNKGEKGGKPQFAERGQHGQHGHGEGRPEGRSHGEGRGDWHHSHADAEEPTLLSPFAHWQQTYERISAQNPGKDITVSTEGSVSVSLGNSAGNQRAADRYTFDSATGRITDVQKYADTDFSSRLRGWIYAVHVGSWGGMLTRIITFLAVLIGASLPISGYVLWVRKPKHKPAAK